MEHNQNPPWLMTFYLVDGKLCEDLGLKGELIEYLRDINEGSGWKGCKRRSKAPPPESKITPKSVQVPLPVTSPGVESDPEVQEEPSNLEEPQELVKIWGWGRTY